MLDMSKLRKCETLAQVMVLVAKEKANEYGSHRRVYKLKNAVVKVPRYGWAVLYNEREIELSSRLPKDAPIARVLEHAPNGVWLVMEKAKTIPRNKGGMSIYQQEWDDIAAYGIHDIHEGNVGYIGGRMVSIDYGIAEGRS